MSLARRCRAGLLGLCLAASALPLWAASLGISPLRAELAPGQSTAALTLRNMGDDAVLVQARVVAWSQKDGEDVFDATEDVIVSPPIFTLAGNGSQVVRVGLRRSPDAQRELAYRVFLQEVPQPPKPGQPGVQMALRIGLPVFVAPQQAAKPQLAWRAVREPNGELRVVADNPGLVHVQVLNFSLVGLAEGAPEVARNGNAAYVLPGQRQQWRLKPEAPPAIGTRLRVLAQTDAGDLPSELSVDAP